MKNTSSILRFSTVTAFAFSAAALHADEYYRYDESGNLSERRIAGEVARMDYTASNQLKTVEGPDGSVAFGYDRNGGVISEVGANSDTAYNRGHQSRIKSVSRDGKTVDVFYDHRGFPAGKRSNSEITHWVWEGAEIRVLGDDVRNPEMELRDYLGSDLANSGESGTAFGSNQTDVSYTGKFYDAEIGAHIFPYRFYRADLGRWLGRDPMGFPDGGNRYAYVDDPLVFVDPLGLRKKLYDPFTLDVSHYDTQPLPFYLPSPTGEVLFKEIRWGFTAKKDPMSALTVTLNPGGSVSWTWENSTKLGYEIQTRNAQGATISTEIHFWKVLDVEGTQSITKTYIQGATTESVTTTGVKMEHNYSSTAPIKEECWPCARDVMGRKQQRVLLEYNAETDEYDPITDPEWSDLPRYETGPNGQQTPVGFMEIGGLDNRGIEIWEQ